MNVRRGVGLSSLFDTKDTQIFKSTLFMPSSSAAVTPVAEERISSLLETALSSVEAAKEFYNFVMSGEVRDETFSERVYE